MSENVLKKVFDALGSLVRAEEDMLEDKRS